MFNTVSYGVFLDVFHGKNKVESSKIKVNSEKMFFLLENEKMHGP